MTSKHSAVPLVLAVVGRSGVGKTHLIESLLRLLRESAVKVATVKHTHHPVFEDKVGTDTDRHRRAGAHLSALSGPGFCTFFTDGELSFEQVLCAAGSGADLILVEGYKSQSIRRIEVVRDEEPMLAADDRWMTVKSGQVSEVLDAILTLLELDRSKPHG